ncbi:signal recognition particle receptor subunit alpha [Triplophysa dalaica]|uniref:signal recognition particle receptor subunit alpha n=1 Tax=Triplophysa dalaica TaxID=1582913 RepID=UPI0024E020B4|nr:signal recognition particle receptor subunit alpha [Triplophysa dalaica]XP_056621630.1 signal recognition particle receptor subunit alpha [Triplophysa dalaica]
MLDFFAIFSKGGIVLWCFQGAGVTESFTGPVNALIRSVILQERSGNNSFTHNALSLKYKLDNEFELVFVVGFQKILTLTYVDKFIDDVQLQFRDRYKNKLEQRGALKFLLHNFEFGDDFHQLLKEAEESSRAKARASMRTFNESQKSQKTVKSMIETKDGDKIKEPGGKKSKNPKKEVETRVDQPKAAPQTPPKKNVENGIEALTQEEIIEQNRAKFISKQLGGGKPEKISKSSPKPQKPKGKEKRVWDMGGKITRELDYSGPNGDNSSDAQNQDKKTSVEPLIQVDSMIGDLPGVDYESSDEEDDDDEEDEEEQKEEEKEEKKRVVVANTNKRGAKKSGFGGMFGMLKGLVGSKNLTEEDMIPVLDKMKDHLIAKNVAAEISSQLCDSVAKKLEGKVMGTFTTVASTVKQSLQDSLVQILQPKRRVDILRDVLEARSQRKPFVITFCGVNGVGKSTNLAKISYWLIENGITVLIAACDTFRAGAVEQLRTHQRRLNSLHPPEKHGGRPAVELFEKGYGKDAAGIAMEAIAFARNQSFDVVLIDTAGRMQDNAPLMTALAKLIAVNNPDLVLFVGEALVGNEAVDQLVKFNQALADHSKTDKPRLIDGIVLTKFDTIDDKVGAAISMTYITGQPIVFVGTGQTYSDLRSLNARAVVSALMKA